MAAAFAVRILGRIGEEATIIGLIGVFALGLSVAINIGGIRLTACIWDPCVIGIFAYIRHRAPADFKTITVVIDTVTIKFWVFRKAIWISVITIRIYR